MIRNAIGSLIALIGAAAAVWSTFLPWYGGRDGKDFALSDLFTSTGVSGSQPALLLGLFLPMLVAAILTVLGVLLRSRLLVALAALLTLAFAVLWIIRQGIAEGSLTFGGEGNLDWGVGIAFASAVVLLFGALFMAGRHPKSRGRHRAASDTRLRRRGSAPAAGAAAGAGAGAAGLAATSSDDRRGTKADETRPAPAGPARGAGPRTDAGTGSTAAGTGRRGDRDETAADATRPMPAAGAGGEATPTAAGAGPSPGEQAPRPVTGSDRREPGGTTAGTEPAPGTTTGPAGTAATTGPAARGRGADDTGTAPAGGTSPAETTRPMPHTQPVTGSGEEAGEGRRAGAASGGAATGAGAGAGAAGSTGAGMGDFPRDERADWGRDREGTRPAGTGASPGEPAERPLAGAGAGSGGPTRSADMRAEKGPDAMRPDEARRGTAPEAGGRKEPLPQRLLHRFQHRGHHGPRGGDHRDAA